MKSSSGVASALALAWFCCSATAPALAQEENAANPATGVPGAGSIFDRAKSMFSAPKTGADDTEGANGRADKRGAGGDRAERGERGGRGERYERAERRRDEPESEPKEKSFFGNVKGIFGIGSEEKSVTKIKDITEVSSISARQFDPACTTIVEPFGVTDNLGSMAMLGAKVALGNVALSINGGGAQQNVRSTLRMAGKNLNWLPMRAERMLGEHQHAELAGQLLDPSRKSDKEIIARANAMLQKLLEQVKEETPYQFDLSVQRKGGANAQALPGGFILIEKDLAADKKKEGIAYFALAHEIAHVLQRHETRSIQARLTDSIDSLDGLKKLIDSATSNPGALVGYSNELMSRFVVFSQSQELQADACAVRLLDSAFADRKRLAEVIRSYAKSLPAAPTATAPQNQLEMFVDNVGKMSKLQDQHPNSQERSLNLEKMLVEVATAKTRVAGSPVVVTPR